jgi:uncharacterized protein (TIGR01777 family)
MSQQSIAVSGASGLVGTRLCSLLQDSGHAISPISRQAGEGNTILWDPTRGLLNPSRLESVDTLIHLAGENIASSRWNDTVRKKIRDSRVEGTRHLVNSIRDLQKKPSTLICASAIGIYGDRGTEVLNEQSAPGDGFLVDVCKDWEKEAQAATELGMRVVNVRIGVVITSKGGALANMLTPFRLGLGGIVGNGKQYWSWIGLQDVARVIQFCAENQEISGPVNAVSPYTATNFDFTKTLGSVLRRPTLFPLPAFMARIVLGEMADELLLASTRVTPQELLERGFQFEQPELRSCLKAELS